MPDIVVVGSVNADMILRVERLPEVGETLLGREFVIAQGGKGANQAVAAQRAGARVTFIAGIGDDGFGAQALNHLRADGVITEFIVKCPGISSGVALIFVDDHGENCIGVASGANGALIPADVQRASRAITDAAALLVQLETPLETVESAVSIAHASGVPVILNPAPACELPDTLLRKVSVLTPNRLEAGMLTGTNVSDRDGARRAASRLRERGVESAVVTMGAEGLVGSTADGMFEMDAYPVAARDATAAGDVFNGVLAVALAEGSPLREAARRASAAAALSVTRLGAQPSIPSRTEIDAFLGQYGAHHAATGA